MERTAETQRLKLLRLLAGWLAVVGFLSAAPLSPVWTRWFRGFLSSVLMRAETAGHCLLFVEARRLAKARGVALDQEWLLRQHGDLFAGCGGDEPPTLSALRRRIVALRCLLENLPRRGMRLMHRIAAGLGTPDVSDRSAPETLRDLRTLPAVNQCSPRRPWHPPERALTLQF